MHETAAELSLGVISAENFIREHLKFSKVSARWIPISNTTDRLQHHHHHHHHVVF